MAWVEVLNITGPPGADGSDGAPGEPGDPTAVEDGAIPQAKVADLVSDLADKADDSGVVHNTGNEQIAGQKSIVDPMLFVAPDLTTVVCWNGRATADAKARVLMWADGYLGWGDGTNDYDTALYRASAGFIRIDGGLHVSQGLTKDSMPLVSNNIRSLTGQSGNVTIDASVQGGTTGGGNLVNIEATGAVTLMPPSNPSDFQQLRIHIVADGAARTVSINSGILLSTGLSNSYALTRGQVLSVILEYIGNKQNTSDSSTPAWGLMSATVVG